ncbi:MAG TPA: aromatic aminobenezylarsenical efflux permease ArsG family transporter [Planctomycetota bacterium]|nr:aromatic aminobenezylarsenical efflux permease ArsG family transporter [Planctomycetota bacterium]
MKWKWLIAAPLLAFVAASLVTLVVKEVRPGPTARAEAQGPFNGISVYYFHGNKRCDSCRKIERLSREALEKGFPQELRQGQAEWHVANYQAPGNEGFEKAYEIAASTVVLVEFRDGKPGRYKNLEEVWDYLDDGPRLVGFVQGAVGAFLKDERAAGGGPLAKGLLLAALSALWLGILTSISPCPLATNIAAISFVGRRVGSSRQVLLSGLLYTVGRTLVYVVLAALIVGGLLYKAQVAAALSRYMNRFLGPILLLVGIVLLRLVELSFRGFAPGEATQRRVEAMGVWGAGLLGILFALAFCPVSAALFFGSLLGLALQSQSSVLLPTLFGLGTAVPVVAVAVVLAFSAQSVGKVFHRLTQFERWARWATGALFVLIGGYFCLAYIYGVL